jgi:putative methyltransferase (TIGR04325 family)
MTFFRKEGRALTPAGVYRAIRRRVVNRAFPVNALRGVYGSFAEAAAAAPSIKPIGYELANSGNWYEEKFSKINLEDYPVLFWLKDALASSRSLLEIGGHVGEAYYAFRRLLEYPPSMEWTILDVPSIVSEGSRRAQANGAKGLHFCDKLQTATRAEIVLAAGALQYFEEPVLVDVIRQMEGSPQHIIVNSTAMYDGPSYITLQNIGTVYCPYRIFNRTELVESIEREGYRLVDSWSKPRRVHVPGHPEKNFDGYSGLYFRRR